MRKIGFFILALTLHSASAATITSQIHEIDYGRMGEEVLLLLKSGDVLTVPQSKLELLDTLATRKNQDSWYTFNHGPERQLQSIDEVNDPAIYTEVEKDFLPEMNYVPTTVASMGLATKYISESRRTTKELTQCFNRAHVWAYEWWRNHSLRSQKLFIFWTKEYVRKYGFKWWFHVTPYVHVKDNDGQVKERVLDVKYLSRPYEFQAWANYHSNKDMNCKVAGKYSDYADNPFEPACYLMRANMYFWQPADLEMNEAWGYSKNAYNMDEVRAAFLEAFDITLP